MRPALVPPGCPGRRTEPPANWRPRPSRNSTRNTPVTAAGRPHPACPGQPKQPITAASPRRRHPARNGHKIQPPTARPAPDQRATCPVSRRHCRAAAGDPGGGWQPGRPDRPWEVTGTRPAIFTGPWSPAPALPINLRRRPPLGAAPGPARADGTGHVGAGPIAPRLPPERAPHRQPFQPAGRHRTTNPPGTVDRAGLDCRRPTGHLQPQRGPHPGWRSGTGFS